MGLLILLLVLGLPIAEIAGFVVIGGQIGVLATLAWVFLAGIAGIVVIRLQGLATALQLRNALARDELPARALFDGALVSVAGFLLLVPGFVSDAIAVLLLLPPLRNLLFGLLARRVSVHMRMARRSGMPPQDGPAAGGPTVRGPAAGPRGVVIDGEFSEIDPERQGDGGGGQARLPGDDRRNS